MLTIRCSCGPHEDPLHCRSWVYYQTARPFFLTNPKRYGWSFRSVPMRVTDRNARIKKAVARKRQAA